MFIINRAGTPTSQGSTRKVAQTEKTISSEGSKTTHPSIRPSSRRNSSPADVIRASPLIGVSLHTNNSCPLPVLSVQISQV